MGLIMKGGGNQPTILYERVPLTVFYLNCAYKAAKSALVALDKPKQIEQQIEERVLTILWSTLALEAGANEFIENLISDDKEIKDFDLCRNKYKRPAAISRTIWKWKLLFKLGCHAEITLSEPFLVDAEKLVQTRHLLSHYKPQDTSRKFYYNPNPPIKTVSGGYFGVMWYATTVLDKVEPSSIEKTVLNQSPNNFFMAARSVFLEWELKNGRDGSDLNKAIPSL